MKEYKIERESVIELIEEHKWIRNILIAGGAVIGIWVLGKASKLLSDAIVNFKNFHHAIKH